MATEKRIHLLDESATLPSGVSLPFDKSGRSAAGRVTDATAAAGLFDLESLSGKVVWVDSVNGSNATGARGKPHRPFLTLPAAQTAALAGDTIIVLPGAYTDQITLANGVNWFFFPGTTLTTTGVDAVVCGAGVTATIRGWGEFIGGSGKTGLRVTGGTLIVEASRVAGGTNGEGLGISGGTVTIQAAIAGIGNVGVNMTGGTLTVQRSRITSTSTHVVQADSSGLTLWDCVLVTPAAANSLSAGSAQTVKNYGAVANKAVHANVTVQVITPLLVDANVT